MNTRYRGTRRLDDVKRKMNRTAPIPVSQALPNGAPIEPTETPVPIKSINDSKAVPSDLIGNGGVSTGFSKMVLGSNMMVAAK